MTHYEDVKRAATPTTIDYLNARVEALERRVKYLEQIIEIDQNIIDKARMSLEEMFRLAE